MTEAEARELLGNLLRKSAEANGELCKIGRTISSSQNGFIIEAAFHKEGKEPKEPFTQWYVHAANGYITLAI